MRRLPSLTALRFFEETVRHKSFGKAARVLNVTQGAVSRQIKTLEQSLGVTLFERHPQGLELTASARSLLPFVTQAFDLLEQGVDGLSSDGPQGTPSGRGAAHLRHLLVVAEAGTVGRADAQRRCDSADRAG